MSAWLDVLCRLMRLGGSETTAIRTELEEHLRERIRDLMVDGVQEDAATRRAIEELGEAAVLADRFRRAERSPRRRMAMNIALVGLAAGAAVLGALSLHQNGAKPVPGAIPPPQVRYAGREIADQTITLATDATLDKLTQELGRASEHAVNVYWDVLGEQGLKRETPIGVPLAGVSVETALAIANERLGSDKQIACRMTGDTLEVSTLRHFDKREITLRAYDVASVLTAFQPVRQPAEVAQELQALVRGVIDPDQWRENGGDLAQMYMVGTKLFVTAPARFHPTVEWILGQLQGGAAAAATGSGAGAGRQGLVYITGEVVRPGPYNVPEAGVTLRQAIIAAGGKLEDVSEVTITRSKDGTIETVKRLGASDLRGSSAQDPALEAGEIVDVRLGKASAESAPAGVVAVAAADHGGGPPRSQPTYSITGEIGMPGTYVVPAEGLTLRRAIVAAGGNLDKVKEVVVSRTENGRIRVLHQLRGEQLRGEHAEDPSLASGEVIEVR